MYKPSPASRAGAAPPPGSDIYRDLQSYFYWLAEDAPSGKKIAGLGYPTPPIPTAGYDLQHSYYGKVVKPRVMGAGTSHQ